MFKSKHSGWTFELKRTPFGGGGGGFSGITDSISSALGTDGSGGGALGALASIDPGPAIGSALASVDKTVGDVVPGGWGTIAALAAAIATAGTSIPESEAMFMAQDAANLASQGLSQEAIAQNLAISYNISAADAATAAAATNAGAAETFAQTGSLPIQEPPAPTTSVPGADQVLAQPDVNVNLGATNGGTVNSLNPALPATGAPSGTSVGMSGQLAPGTVLGNGLEGGGAIGSSYAAGANGMPATDFFGNYVPASSINTGGVPNTIAGTTGTTTNTDLLKLLKQGAGSGLSSSLGKLAAGQNASASALPNLVRGNQSPFAYTAQQPIRDAQPMDLNSLANLLKQG